MAWTAPITFVPDTVLTAAQLNIHVRDNLNETAPAKASTVGSIFVTSGKNRISEQYPQFDFVEATETTTSQEFTDLKSSGPEVTTHATFGAFISISAQLQNSVNGGFCIVGFTVVKPPQTEEEGTDGEVVHDPTDERSLLHESGSSGQDRTGSYTTLIGVPEPGEYTFIMKYRVTTGTGTFLRRYLTLIPF